MKKNTLKAEKRDLLGRKVKKLRSEGKIPAVVYGKAFNSLSVSVAEKEFEEVFGEAGETNIVDLVIGKRNYPVLIHTIQTHPVSDEPLHIDFLKVNLKEKVTANVPVEIVGESPAEKQALGTLVKYIDEIEVECLPSDIPDKFEVDVSGLLQVDDQVLLKDLKIGSSKVEIKEEPETVIVKIEPQKEEEEEPVQVEEIEGSEEEQTETGEAEAEEKKTESEDKEKEEKEKKN